MINVEVHVPMIQKSYDFMLDESVRVYSVIEEIVELICQKEGFTEIEDSKGFHLFSYLTESLLNPEANFIENGVTNGMCLILC